MSLVIKKVVKAEFWCYSSLPLEQLFAKFRCGFPANDNDFILDSENVYVWFEGIAADSSLWFNISRPYEDLDEFGLEQQPIATEPVRFSLSIIADDMTVSEIGRRLAGALGLDVHTGEVVYLNGNDFRFDIANTFRPT